MNIIEGKNLALLFFFFYLTTAFQTATAQEIKKTYYPNPNGPKELEQYQFVIGTWELEISYKNGEGSWDKYKGEWFCEWMVDGYLLHQDWRGPFIRGSEFKVYDSKTNKWVGQYYYTGRQWTQTEGENIDGKIITLKTNNSNPDKPFINKETYYNISEKSFEVKSEVSFNDGKTWHEGFYKIKAKRK